MERNQQELKPWAPVCNQRFTNKTGGGESGDESVKVSYISIQISA
uniref:Uncharacterized protein n=1 Tax=Meloidogyne enterolobii TaxID=390850 RepID=A0A6V7Y161_MELEN|nr:unnamed protein product [Meloidogyne enterolobii]